MLRRSERAEAARQQLEELGRELAAGRAAARAESEPEGEGDAATGVVLPMPGRHARGRPALVSRWSPPEWLPRLPEYGVGHLAAVAVAVAVALGVTAWIVIRSAPTAVPAPVAQTTGPSASATPSAPASVETSVAAPTSASPAPLVVDVGGRVRHPGVVRLAPGARVIDALRRAGGARPGTDLTSLNLARPVTDGEQILVRRHGSTSVTSAAPGSTSASAGPVGKVALNTATLEQLDTLPGVGPVTAQKILDWRTAHGRFTSVGDPLAPAATMIWLGVIIGTIFIVGWLAAKVVPGTTSDFILEIPPVRIPKLSNIAIKVLARTEWYLKEAVPLFIVGTLLLYLLDAFHLLAYVQRGLSPVVVGALGLPAEAANSFVIGFLRRDYGAAGLFMLQKNGQLDGVQTVVALTTITLFIPCVANLLVMIKEQGQKAGYAIAGFVLFFAFGVGALLNFSLRLLGVRL